MLDHYFKRSNRIRSLRSGLSGPFLDDFAVWLRTSAFSSNLARCYLVDAEHLGIWLARRRIQIRDLDDALIDRFAKHLAKCRCMGTQHNGYRKVPYRVRMFLTHLRRIGAVPQAERLLSARDVLIEEYGDWMRRRRGAQETTIRRSRSVIKAFLGRAGVVPSCFTAAGVRAFVLGYVREHEPSAINVTRVVRGFLRFLIAEGRCAPELAHAVPRVPSPRLATLPAYLRPDQIEKTIAGCGADRVGLRDRALLLLLARLGLRPSDVACLRLGDIDWKHGRICVSGKSRREAWLPLPQDAGDAIIAYLTSGRPCTNHEHLFIAVNAPFGPLHARSVSARAVEAMKRVGIDPPHGCGACVFRHSLATRMLREDATLDLIGAVMRHRRVETTAIYAKVDICALREIAQPWPITEGPSC